MGFLMLQNEEAYRSEVQNDVSRCLVKAVFSSECGLRCRFSGYAW